MPDQSDFELKLHDIVDNHLDAGGSLGDIISALELSLTAMKDEGEGDE